MAALGRNTEITFLDRDESQVNVVLVSGTLLILTLSINISVRLQPLAKAFNLTPTSLNFTEAEAMKFVLLVILTGLAFSHVVSRGIRFKGRKQSISIPQPRVPVRVPVVLPVPVPNYNQFGYGYRIYRPRPTTPAPNSLLLQLIPTILKINQPSFYEEMSEIKEELRHYVNQTNEFRDIDSGALSTIINLLANEEVGKFLIPLLKVVHQRENQKVLDEQTAPELVKKVFQINDLNSQLQPAMTRFYCDFNEQNDRITVAVARFLEENRGTKALRPENAGKAISISRRISNLGKPFRNIFESRLSCPHTISMNTSAEAMIGMDNVYSFILFLIHSLFPEPEPI